MAFGITMDGIKYNVAVTYDSMQREFELKNGPFTGDSLAGRKILDILGTTYTYSMTVEPYEDDLASYNAFYQAVTSPVAYHTITLPYGQTTMTFQATIESGSDTYGGYLGTERYWHNLQIKYVPMEPQRVP